MWLHANPSPLIGKSESIDAMRLRNPSNPAEDELRAWAYDPDAREPMQDWDLVLAWQVDRGFLGRCVVYAADPSCPKADFFLDVLFQWVETAAPVWSISTFSGRRSTTGLTLHEALLTAVSKTGDIRHGSCFRVSNRLSASGGWPSGLRRGRRPDKI